MIFQNWMTNVLLNEKKISKQKFLDLLAFLYVTISIFGFLIFAEALSLNPPYKNVAVLDPDYRTAASVFAPWRPTENGILRRRSVGPT